MIIIYFYIFSLKKVIKKITNKYLNLVYQYLTIYTTNL